MILPLLMLDACVSFHQWACFAIYGITKVRRTDYLVFDRRHLAYLNFIEKFHCTYCEYGNGLMSYMTEILARTEQYFCPIKYARKILGTHSRYNRRRILLVLLRVHHTGCRAIAWRTRSASRGSLNIRTPVASNTALAITAPVVVIAGSPQPWGARSSFLTSTTSTAGAAPIRGMS